MKPGIHPEYRTVLFHDTAADVYFLIGSTVETTRTETHADGNVYPYVALDVSSASHPVYTGQVRKTQAEGRIAGFNKRFAGFSSKKGMPRCSDAACTAATRTVTPVAAAQAAPSGASIWNFGAPIATVYRLLAANKTIANKP